MAEPPTDKDAVGITVTPMLPMSMSRRGCVTFRRAVVKVGNIGNDTLYHVDYDDGPGGDKAVLGGTEYGRAYKLSTG
jgi:hypothetical protein